MIKLEDLRELEHLIQERFDRIEKGMFILKDLISHGRGDYEAQGRWDQWKKEQKAWWNPKTESFEPESEDFEMEPCFDGTAILYIPKPSEPKIVQDNTAILPDPPPKCFRCHKVIPPGYFVEEGEKKYHENCYEEKYRDVGEE